MFCLTFAWHSQSTAILLRQLLLNNLVWEQHSLTFVKRDAPAQCLFVFCFSWHSQTRLLTNNGLNSIVVLLGVSWKHKKKHCAGASLLTKVRECCSKTRLLTKSGIKSMAFSWECHERVKKQQKKHIAPEQADAHFLLLCSINMSCRHILWSNHHTIWPCHPVIWTDYYFVYDHITIVYGHIAVSCHETIRSWHQIKAQIHQACL